MASNWRFFALDRGNPITGDDLGALEDLEIGRWFRAERVTDLHWHVRIGSRDYDVHLQKNGQMRLMAERNEEEAS